MGKVKVKIVTSFSRLKTSMVISCLRAHVHTASLRGILDGDYMSADASDAVRKMAGQFQELIDYLVGRDISAVNDLYLPRNIATDTDVSSAATLRAPKIISAIWEGLNKNECIVK